MAMSNRYSTASKYQFSAGFKPYYSKDPNEGFTCFQDDAQNISLGLYYETPIGKTIIDRLAQKVIGSGLTPMSSPETDVLGWTQEQTERFQKQTESLYRILTGSTSFDWHGRNTLKQMQSQAFKMILNSGDVLLHRGYRKEKGRVMPYVQIISGRFIGNPNFQNDTKTLIGGVKLDENGKEVGYYIMVPDENLEDSTNYKYVTKTNRKTQKEDYIMIQLASSESGMVRGIPFLRAVKDSLLQCSKMQELYITKAIIQTLFSVFIQKSQADEPGAESFKSKVKLGIAEAEQAHEIDEARPDYELAPGAIIEGNPGETFVPVETKLQATDFSEALKTILTIIGAACGLPYEELIGSYNASFSASRATINDSEKGYRTLREEFCKKFLDPVYELVVDYGVMAGMIEAPGYMDSEINRRAVLACTWTGTTPTQVDPTKEVAAYAAAVQAGFCTREYATRCLYGLDFEEVIERLSKEQSMIDGLLSNKEDKDTTAVDSEDKDEKEDGDERSNPEE